VDEVSCSDPLPEGDISTELAKLLEPKPYEPAPPKGTAKRRTARGVSICVPLKSGASRVSSGKEEVDGDAKEEEEVSTSKKEDSEVSEERAGSLPPRTRKRSSRSATVIS
jgi:hypothetical protein